MSRFPPIPPAEQTSAQELLHNEMDHFTQKEFGSTFTLKNSEGALLGPFAPLLYTPSVGTAWLHLNHLIMKIPTITLRERELAIFAVLAYSPAAYAVYAHKKIGAKAGFSPAQEADALEGKVPEGLSEKEEATYVLAGELVRMRGPLSEESFQRASRVLGKEGAAGVIHTAGAFFYSTILLNAADVPAPQ